MASTNQVSTTSSLNITTSNEYVLFPIKDNLGKGVIDREARRRLKDLPLYAAKVVMKEFLKALALPGAEPDMSALLSGIMTQ